MNNHFTPSDPDLGDTAPSLAAADTASFDASHYLDDLDGLDLTETAKIELLTVLHDILFHFVQMGFDLKDADVCGQLFADFMDAASGGPDGVESASSLAPEIPADQTTKEDSHD
jgi:hypothetical protein